MTKTEPKNKNLVFLKSSVIALGIVFLVLLALLIILKTNKSSKNTKTLIACDQQQIVIINNDVQKLMDSKNEIIILTKPKAGQQELVLLDKRCGFLKRKIKLNINSHLDIPNPHHILNQ